MAFLPPQLQCQLMQPLKYHSYTLNRERSEIVSCTGRPAGRAGPQPMGRAGPGLINILRAGPGAGLELEGPGRARACKY